MKRVNKNDTVLYEELEAAVKELLDFVSNKYGVKSIDEWMCPHHKKLAELIEYHTGGIK